jgi:hypothetical protein
MDTWSARSQSLVSLRNICRNHPLLIETSQQKYLMLNENRKIEILRREHEKKVLKGMIEFYKKQLNLSRIELILRCENKPILCFR